MPLFSHDTADLPPALRRRVYARFQQAVNRGELPAIRTTGRFQLLGARGQTRSVYDYGYTNRSAPDIRRWLADVERLPTTPNSVTSEDVLSMSDDELQALINAKLSARKCKKTTPKKPRKKSFSASHTQD